MLNTFKYKFLRNNNVSRSLSLCGKLEFLFIAATLTFLDAMNNIFNLKGNCVLRTLKKKLRYFFGTYVP